ncbi:MAG: EAL domain-containing protein [Pseudolabrys sp.]|nr:EAL domain-containing protein [Pseudolabrys sp.]
MAGASLVAFNSWLDGFIARQGQAEVASAARRAVGLAEFRLQEAAAALDALALQGVNSCAAGNIPALRAATFAAAPIKAVTVLDSDRQSLCADLDAPFAGADLLTTVPAGADGVSLDIMLLSNGERMARLRRIAGEGPAEIAALIPVSLLLPQVSIPGSSVSAYAQLTTRDGILIGAVGLRPPGAEARFAATAASDTFAFNAEIVVPYGILPSENAGLKRLGLILPGIVVAMLIICALVMRRRDAENPVAELQRALAAGELIPYYQPIVDIRSGKLRGAEVLVRWRKPDGTLVLPGAFIPLAESSGMIRAMTHDLMKRVCVEAGRAIGARPGLKISFNFAGQLFGDQSIVKDVRNIFSGTPIKLSQVVLEVTERDPIENFTATRQTIAALQGLGVRIAIDDVGTGHSGLSYMLKLGVDIIKIDKIFVDAIGTDRNSNTIVETLVDLAHNMRMDVVAEGVETFEQVMYLRDLGVRSAQGYVFAPPLPGSAFLQLVDAIDPLTAARVPEAGRASAA